MRVWVLALFTSIYLISDAPSVLWSRTGAPCLPDDEGSWSIGIFRGSSPLNLTPIETTTPRLDVAGTRAWPIANPILTCASITDAPSNFVAKPFLFAASGAPKELGSAGPPIHLFFETKSNVAGKGEIGVAQSIDGGATWTYLGIALSANWHLSYPQVFSYNNQIYMLPESPSTGVLHLYKAVEFPLKWELAQELVNKPLLGASIVEWQERWYLFATDPSRPGYRKNSELQIFHAESPLGPWSRHFLSPVVFNDPKAGARMGGRIIQHNGKLYRFAQDSTRTYGGNIIAYRIDSLSPTEFQQTRIKFTAKRTEQGAAAWNGVRRHHFDALKLGDGSWIAAMDGDFREDGHVTKPLLRRATVVGLAWAAAAVVIALAATDKRYGRSHMMMKRSGSLPLFTMALTPSPLVQGKPGSPKAPPKSPGNNVVGRLTLSPSQQRLRQLRRSPAPVQGWSWRHSSFKMPRSGLLALLLLAILIPILFLPSILGALSYLALVRDTPIASSAVPINDTFSKYTIVILSFPDRINTLRSIVAHYGQCPSVAQILVVWNGQELPTGIAAAVPVRLKIESRHQSLNNRFKPDLLIPTRAVLSLDDDIWMKCSDLEGAFAQWRLHPKAIVGFHPRLLRAGPGAYHNEFETLESGRFNALWTGAAFLDWEQWFTAYWQEGSFEKARQIVDEHFDCEDILMNYLVANATQIESNEQHLVYLDARGSLDVSAAAGIGGRRAGARTTRRAGREECIDEFADIFGKFPLREYSLDSY